MINYLCPFYCLTGQIILCSLELHSNIPSHWADHSIHHLLEINMPNTYFFHLPLMRNVTSFLQALVRFSMRRAPGFPAVKAVESDSTQPWSRGKPKQTVPPRRDIPRPAHNHSKPWNTPDHLPWVHVNYTENILPEIHITTTFLGFLGKRTKCCTPTWSPPWRSAAGTPKVASSPTSQILLGKQRPAGNSKTERRAKWKL